MARPHATIVVLLLAYLQTEGMRAQPTSDPGEIARICKISVETNDLSCLHGGYLRAENVTDEPTSCSECICPSGWTGSDCSLCTSLSSCPAMTLSDGSVIPASGCTSDSISPVSNEFAVGKSLSCTCGGDDASTQYICGQQPGTVLDIAFLPSGASGEWSNGNASAKVYERAGLYSAEYFPDWIKPGCDTTIVDPECYTLERWKYAYPGVWDGSFSRCSWAQGTCLSPLEGNDCWTYTCLSSNISCPASTNVKCEGWTPVSCAMAPDGNRPYWSHHCLPGTYPGPGKALTLSCKPTRDDDGKFQCYITQEGSYIASLGMRCSTGSCLYNVAPPSPAPEPPYSPGPRPDPSPSPPDPPPAPHPPPAPPPPGPPSIHLHTETLLLIFLGTAILALLFGAGYVTYLDMKRARDWMDGGAGGGMDGPLLTGRERASGSGTNGFGSGNDTWAHSNASLAPNPSWAAAKFGSIRSQIASIIGFGASTSGDPDGSAEPLLSSPHLHQPQPSGNSAALIGSERSNSSLNDGRRSEPQGPPVLLSWHNLSVTVPRVADGDLVILRSVSGLAGQSPAHSEGNLQASSLHHSAVATLSNTQLPHKQPSQPQLSSGFSGKLRGSSSSGGDGGHGSSMTAILGPSGAGKTTLLDVLSGRKSGSGVHGEVRLSGRTVTAAQMRQVCGYVQQEDVLPGTLAVVEYLLFHAALRLEPSRYSEARRQRIVWSIIQELGLSKVAHSRIGDAFVRGLSGGEKRRVSIASELLTRPGVLFLDEPTTGLDSTNAAKVVDIMADLARGGVTVVLSIHQPRPDIFRLMDRVVLLSGQGQVVYSGPVDSAADHFASMGHSPSNSSINIADYMLDMVIRSSVDEVGRLVDAFAGCRIPYEDECLVAPLLSEPRELPPLKYQAPYWKQLSCLSSRQLRNTYRHPFLITLNFTATLVTAVGLGLIFSNAGTDTSGIQNRLGVLFFMLLYLSLMALTSLPIWRDEKLLFLRERDSGAYGTPAYFAAVVLFDLLPMRIIPPTFFALFSYWMIGLHKSSAVCLLWFIGILVSSNITASTMCMAIGAASPSNAVANMVGSLTLMLLLLFGGFLLNKDKVPHYVKWLSDFSFFNYAYEGLAVNEFHHFPLDFTFTAPIDTEGIIPPLRITGDGVLVEFGFAPERFPLDVVMLLLLGGAFTALTFIILLASGSSAVEAVKLRMMKHRLQVFAIITDLCRRLGMLQSSSGTSTAPAGSERRPAQTEIEIDIVVDPSEVRVGTRLASHAITDSNSTSQSDAHRGGDSAFMLPQNGSSQQAASTGAWFPPGKLVTGKRKAVNGQQPTVTISLLAEDQQQLQQGQQNPMVLSWENLSCRVKQSSGGGGYRYILQSVSGLAGPQTIQSASPSHTASAAAAANGHFTRPAQAEQSGERMNGNGSVGQRGSTSVDACGAGSPSGSCLFAILGPSGAGKTTLLDILAGRKAGGGVTGEVRINGHRMDARGLRKACGYVPQECILPGTSTVREYLLFHASLRMPAFSSPSEVSSRVDAIIAELGLEKVEHSRIGDAFVRGLSGGEKRRVSIASELLTRPGVLFLDEPTTGLDSTNAAKVVDIMADLARGGVTVVLSIHQPRPDIFRLMDRVMLLSGEGQVVFTGPTDKAAVHFVSLGVTPPSDNVAVADMVLDLVIKAPRSQVASWVDAFASSEVAAADAAWLSRMQFGNALLQIQTAQALSGLKKYEASLTKQLHALAKRLLLNAARHPLLIALNFVATGIMALGIGAIYWQTGRDTGGIQDRCGSLFFMCMYLSLMSLSSLPLWRDDRLVFMKERSAGAYGTAAYFMAVVLFDVLPLRVLPPLLFTLTSYAMIGLRPGFSHMLRNALVLILTNVTAASLNMAIGAAISNVALANMVGSLSVLLSTLLGGFLLSRNKMPVVVAWVARLSYIRYAFEALTINEFHGAVDFKFTGFRQPGQPEDQVPFVSVTGDDVLAVFGLSTDTFMWDCTMLGGLCAIFLTATFYLLRHVGRV